MLQPVAGVQHIQVYRRRIMHDASVVLAGKDVARSAHIGGQLIDFVESRPRAALTTSGWRRSACMKLVKSQAGRKLMTLEIDPADPIS